jgi:hypothetical protein
MTHIHLEQELIINRFVVASVLPIRSWVNMMGTFVALGCVCNGCWLTVFVFLYGHDDDCFMPSCCTKL